MRGLLPHLRAADAGPAATGARLDVGERYAGRGSEPVSIGRIQEELREQLRLAVETENFELAAEIRDRLRVLE